jgi:hypothetical protein
MMTRNRQSTTSGIQPMPAGKEAPIGPPGSAPVAEPTGPAPSTAFRVASWFVALAAVAVFIFGLLELVLMWLPDATLQSVFEEQGSEDLDFLAFRVQFFAVAVAAWTVVLGLLAQLVRPARQVAGMAQAWGAAATMAAMLAAAGAFGLEDAVVLLAVTVVLLLHPHARSCCADLGAWTAGRALCCSSGRCRGWSPRGPGWLRLATPPTCRGRLASRPPDFGARWPRCRC